jgi:hypothetical protein
VCIFAIVFILTCLVYLSVVNACDDAGWLAPVENVNFGWYLLVFTLRVFGYVLC